MNKNIEKHTAGPIAIGFDYQFYLFMFLALKLKHGQTIGFEVKDDIHIDLPDGTTILLQAKHTIQQNISGDLQNLTTLDTDLWKTLSNWANRIKTDKTKADFLNNHSFILVTNKGENKNDFIDALSVFRLNCDIEAIIRSIKAIENQTQDKVLKKYIKNVDSLGKRKLKSFFEYPQYIIILLSQLLRAYRRAFHQNICDLACKQIHSDTTGGTYFLSYGNCLTNSSSHCL